METRLSVVDFVVAIFTSAATARTVRALGAITGNVTEASASVAFPVVTGVATASFGTVTGDVARLAAAVALQSIKKLAWLQPYCRKLNLHRDRVLHIRRRLHHRCRGCRERRTRERCVRFYRSCSKSWLQIRGNRGQCVPACCSCNMMLQ